MFFYKSGKPTAVEQILFSDELLSLTEQLRSYAEGEKAFSEPEANVQMSLFISLFVGIGSQKDGPKREPSF